MVAKVLLCFMAPHFEYSKDVLGWWPEMERIFVDYADKFTSEFTCIIVPDCKCRKREDQQFLFG